MRIAVVIEPPKTSPQRSMRNALSTSRATGLPPKAVYFTLNIHRGAVYTPCDMALRFIHTADWQIGKVFRFGDDATMGGLQLARLGAITRIGQLALEHNARHVLVAGDVYDHATPLPRTRNQAIERMRAYDSVQWHLLPGNHDPYQPNGLWDQLCKRDLPSNVHVHTQQAVTVIEDGVAALLPSPLQYRRTLDDPTAWMDDAHTDDGLIRIGIAHGAVQDFDTDEEQRANRIERMRPQLAGLDYLALGDWHGELQVNERCWYSGTPETDRFQTRGRGTVLLVEIDGPNELPRVTSFPTGHYRWESLDEHLASSEDIDLLEHKLRNPEGDLNRTLVNLRLSGTLSLADMQYFEERIAEGAAAALFHLRIDREHLYPEPTDDDLDSIDPGGIVRAAADKLRATAQDNGNDAAIAREALLRLYVEYKKLESGLR